MSDVPDVLSGTDGDKKLRSPRRRATGPAHADECTRSASSVADDGISLGSVISDKERQE